MRIEIKKNGLKVKVEKIRFKKMQKKLLNEKTMLK